MTNPCRTCDLCESDKNNPRCLKCSKRVKYVSTLGRDLCYSSCRSDMEASVPRVSLMSRQAQFICHGLKFTMNKAPRKPVARTQIQ
jgi:hypothetical protein